VLHPERPIAGTEASPTALAVEVGSAQRQAAEQAAYDLPPAPCIPSRRGASRTGRNGAKLIRVVGIQTSGDCQCRYPKCLATRSHLDGLEVPLLDWSPDQRVYLPDDLRAEGFCEAPFFAASWEAALP